MKKEAIICLDIGGTNLRMGLDNQPIADRLEQACGLPVFLEKDVNLLLTYDLIEQNLPSDSMIIGIYFGAGDGFYSAINGVVELVCRFALAYPLTLIPGVGMWGCFLCSGATWMITSLISLARYRMGSWRKNNGFVN